MLSHPYWAALARNPLLLRVACVVFLVLFIAVTVGFAVLTTALLMRLPSALLMLDVFPLWLPLIMAPLAVYWCLLLRTCDQCGRRVFSRDGRRGYFVSYAQFYADAMNRLMPPPRPKLRVLLGSPVLHTVLHVIRTGELVCVWCGHKDGTKPDYVITGQ